MPAGDPIQAHEEWLAEFERAGQVTVRQARMKVGVGLVACGVIFLAAGLFLLATPGYGLAPDPVTDIAGGMGIVFAVAALAGGTRALIKPALVVHLGPDGLRPAIGPVIPWTEVVDAGVIDAGGTELPAVTVAPTYVARDPGLTGWRRKAWQLNTSMYGNTIPLRHAPPGGNQQVVRLIPAVRERVLPGYSNTSGCGPRSGGRRSGSAKITPGWRRSSTFGENALPGGTDRLGADDHQNEP